MKKIILICLLAICMCCAFGSETNSIEEGLGKLSKTEVGQALASEKLIGFLKSIGQRFEAAFANLVGRIPSISGTALGIVYCALALLALLFIFFGGGLFKLLLFIVGFLAGASIGLEAFAGLPDTWYLILSGVLGLVLGLLANWLQYIGIFLIGAFGGLLAVVMLGFDETLYLIIGLVVGGGIALLVRKFIIAISTSLFGSFLLVGSVSNAILVFQSQAQGTFTVDDVVNSLALKTETWLTWAIVAAFAVVGLVFQMKTKSKKEHD
ncbi:MAG: DUF4203 domain-containing protein [Sphaerochaetaceae bacterium]|jgi:hypothetical protein|nr:DUF4203 domain-containing protein [Sphaerochaetaceae bacterium]